MLLERKALIDNDDPEEPEREEYTSPGFRIYDITITVVVEAK